MGHMEWGGGSLGNGSQQHTLTERVCRSHHTTHTQSWISLFSQGCCRKSFIFMFVSASVVLPAGDESASYRAAAPHPTPSCSQTHILQPPQSADGC